MVSMLYTGQILLFYGLLGPAVQKKGLEKGVVL